MFLFGGKPFKSHPEILSETMRITFIMQTSIEKGVPCWDVSGGVCPGMYRYMTLQVLNRYYPQVRWWKCREWIVGQKKSWLPDCITNKNSWDRIGMFFSSHFFFEAPGGLFVRPDASWCCKDPRHTFQNMWYFKRIILKQSLGRKIPLTKRLWNYFISNINLNQVVGS